MNERTITHAFLFVIVVVALCLRLVVWHWHQFYPLGGDEQEYLDQALTLLREWRYVDLRLMRPPLYGIFLAGCIVLVDSLVQHLRLVQAIISTATVLPVWLLTRELVTLRSGTTPSHQIAPDCMRTVAPLIAALLCALSYTLAAYATELLTETLFLSGLTIVLWLLVRVQNRMSRATASASIAGLVLGLLCLTRSVALVLLPLGILWLLIPALSQRSTAPYPRRLLPAALFLLGTVLVIMPWSVRNTVTYGSLIIIDTTGSENLWLDNDPAGRETVKAQLYALGDDRATRQQRAMERGIAAITNHPHHFVSKAWGELRSFFALEYTDDMRRRQAIWVPPAEVGARLLLGDGVWLVVLLCGTVGLWVESTRAIRTRATTSPAWPFALWGLYILLTALVFHVELRYRLPLYPVLLPYAAITIVHIGTRHVPRHLPPVHALLPLCSIIILMLLHRPYPVLAWNLGWKHLHLARAEYALAREQSSTAQQAAHAALRYDPESALAHVALARAMRLNGNDTEAEALLREAIALKPAHPHAHLLLGDLLRQQGNLQAATHLEYETASLQDLQVWSWQRFTTPATTTLDIGSSLDLGMVQGFYPAEGEDDASARGWRWSMGTARVRLALPAGSGTCTEQEQTEARHTLHLRLASGRPPGVSSPLLHMVVGNDRIGQFQIRPDWHTYMLPLPPCCLNTGEYQTTEEREGCVLTLQSETFRPRSYDRFSDDGRVLGIMVDHIVVNRVSAEE